MLFWLNNDIIMVHALCDNFHVLPVRMLLWRIHVHMMVKHFQFSFVSAMVTLHSEEMRLITWQKGQYLSTQENETIKTIS